MDKLKMHSLDLTQDNIAKIQALFPDCVTEAAGEDGTSQLAIDFDQLRQVLSDHIVDGPQERYRLDWPGKREALLTANAPIAKTLRPARDESVDFDTTQNLFIEGDNLDALKLLQESYLGKVKLIYIDPPYNTGKDFIYEDDFAETTVDFLVRSNQVDGEGGCLVANTESNGRFHSDWLSMIYPRLKICRNLLSDDGVICVSIDENEVNNLKIVMSEIFGSSNFLGTVANINNPKGRSDDKFVATAHEYILIFSKSINNALIWGFEPDEKITKRYSKLTNDGRLFRDIDLRKTGDEDRRSDRPDMFYYFYCDEAGEFLRVSRERDGLTGELEIVPIRDDGSEGRWRWGFDTAVRDIGKLYPKFMPNRKMWGVFEKDLLENRDAVKITSAWTFKDVNSERGSEQFVDLGFDKDVFPRPKPIGTLRRILEFAVRPAEDALVLDFFAGSGAFAQAAMELVAEGKRRIRWILVQLNATTPGDSMARSQGFETISDIAKERARRVAKKIQETHVNPKQSSDFGFRLLKIDSSNMTDVFYRPDEVKQDELFGQVDSVKPGRTGEDLLFQVLIDWGVELALPIKREVLHGKTVYCVDGNALIACFDAGVTDALIKDIAVRAPLRAVFRDTSFARDADRINAEQIFRQLSPGTDLKAI